jgi:hypothetical protein
MFTPCFAGIRVALPMTSSRAFLITMDTFDPFAAGKIRRMSEPTMANGKCGFMVLPFQVFKEKGVIH